MNGICKVALPGTLILASGAFLALGASNHMDTSEYASITAGVQTLAVVVALGLGATTLLRDSRDRRVDRVLALHQELMTGEVWHARYRLRQHLRALSQDGKLKSISHDELVGDETISTYGPDSSDSPIADADLLLRFFERANAARHTNALHSPLFAELIGRHALWWNAAFHESSGWFIRWELTDLASWSRHHLETSKSRNPQMVKWLNTEKRYF